MGYAMEGSPYEGLVCDFVEVLAGYGGAVLDPTNAKSVIVNSPQGVQALTEMASWVGTISPVSVTHSQRNPVVRLSRMVTPSSCATGRMPIRWL